MSRRLVSVALPVRNGADFLGEALDSILAQSHADFDLFVSDNASDDDTPRILADYARRDARVKVSRSDVPLGQVANTNRAVGLADTPWVKLFCHDDLMRRDCLERLVAAIGSLGDHDVAIVGNGERHLYANGFLTPEEPGRAMTVLPGRDALRRRFSSAAHTVPIPAVTNATLRKDAFLEAGEFDAGYVHFEIFCWQKMLLRRDYAFVHEPLTINRIHPRQVAVQARAELRAVDDFRRFYPDFVASHGASLGLGPGARLRARMLPLGIAAAALVSEAKAGRWRRALAMTGRLPASWLVPLAPLILRAWRTETRRLSGLRGKVPPELIYP